MNTIVVLGEKKVLKSKIRIKLAEMEKRQNEITKTLKISPQRFSNWVNGTSFPKLEEAFRLAKLLECSIYDLWEYKEE